MALDNSVLEQMMSANWETNAAKNVNSRWRKDKNWLNEQLDQAETSPETAAQPIIDPESELTALAERTDARSLAETAETMADLEESRLLDLTNTADALVATAIQSFSLRADQQEVLQAQTLEALLKVFRVLSRGEGQDRNISRTNILRQMGAAVREQAKTMQTPALTDKNPAVENSLSLSAARRHFDRALQEDDIREDTTAHRRSITGGSLTITENTETGAVEIRQGRRLIRQHELERPSNLALKKQSIELLARLKQNEHTLSDREPHAQVARAPEPAPALEAQPETRAWYKEMKESHHLPSGPLLERLERYHIGYSRIHVDDCPAFPEAIILERNNPPGTEKMVRIYRGISDMDASALRQIPYAMRTVGEGLRMSQIPEVEAEVALLAHEPTYEHLLAYLDKVRPFLYKHEVERMNDEVADIEGGILSGNCLRICLQHSQYRHGGGAVDSGVSPYISCSIDAQEAIGFSRSGIMVIDIPESQIEGFRSKGTEMSIKGALDPKYITALIPQRPIKGPPDEQKTAILLQLQIALQKVDDTVSIPHYNSDEVLAMQQADNAELSNADREQQQTDMEIIRTKRIEALLTKFNDLSEPIQIARRSAGEQGSDPYLAIQQTIFDHFQHRMENIGHSGYAVTQFDYVKYPELKTLCPKVGRGGIDMNCKIAQAIS